MQDCTFLTVLFTKGISNYIEKSRAERERGERERERFAVLYIKVMFYSVF